MSSRASPANGSCSRSRADCQPGRVAGTAGPAVNRERSDWLGVPSPDSASGGGAFGFGSEGHRSRLMGDERLLLIEAQRVVGGYWSIEVKPVRGAAMSTRLFRTASWIRGPSPTSYSMTD